MILGSSPYPLPAALSPYIEVLWWSFMKLPCCSRSPKTLWKGTAVVHTRKKKLSTWCLHGPTQKSLLFFSQSDTCFQRSLQHSQICMTLSSTFFAGAKKEAMQIQILRALKNPTLRNEKSRPKKTETWTYLFLENHLSSRLPPKKKNEGPPCPLRTEKRNQFGRVVGS